MCYILKSSLKIISKHTTAYYNEQNKSDLQNYDSMVFVGILCGKLNGLMMESWIRVAGVQLVQLNQFNLTEA